MNNVSFSIICCFYNELEILKKNFKKFYEFSNLYKFKYEIFFVDNNSNDGTKEFLLNEKKRNINNHIFIFNNKNLGKGGSIKKALEISKNNYAIIFDIDEYQLEDIQKIYNILIKNDHDFLVGSRIKDDNAKFIYKKNFYGVILLTKIINFLFKLTLSDSAGATKMIKLSEYKKFLFYTYGFDFEFDVLCRFAKHNKKISEFYSEYSPRTYEEGKKIKPFKDGFTILKTIIRNYIKYQ